MRSPRYCCLAACILIPLAALAASSTKPPKPPKPPKIHTVSLGSPRLVTWRNSSTPAKTESLHVRPLYIDGRRKEWTAGDPHDITDSTFVIRQAIHINDSLAADKQSHFVWQQSGWLLIDRTTARITAVHLPGYDPAISAVAWYRDYAAYCGLSSTGNSLYAQIVQLGIRKPAARKKISTWPAPTPQPTLIPAAADITPAAAAPTPTPAQPSLACPAITWQRDPARASFDRANAPAVELSLQNTSAAAIPASPPEP
jgi:hypothetical protein